MASSSRRWRSPSSALRSCWPEVPFQWTRGSTVTRRLRARFAESVPRVTARTCMYALPATDFFNTALLLARGLVTTTAVFCPSTTLPLVVDSDITSDAWRSGSRFVENGSMMGQSRSRPLEAARRVAEPGADEIGEAGACRDRQQPAGRRARERSAPASSTNDAPRSPRARARPTSRRPGRRSGRSEVRQARGEVRGYGRATARDGFLRDVRGDYAWRGVVTNVLMGEPRQMQLGSRPHRSSISRKRSLIFAKFRSGIEGHLRRRARARARDERAALRAATTCANVERPHAARPPPARVHRLRRSRREAVDVPFSCVLCRGGPETHGSSTAEPPLAIEAAARGLKYSSSGSSRLLEQIQGPTQLVEVLDAYAPPC